MSQGCTYCQKIHLELQRGRESLVMPERLKFTELLRNVYPVFDITHPLSITLLLAIKIKNGY